MRVPLFSPVSAFRRYLPLREFVRESVLSKDAVISRAKRGKISFHYAEGVPRGGRYRNGQRLFDVVDLPTECGSQYLADYLLSRMTHTRNDLQAMEERLERVIHHRRSGGAA